MIYACEACAGKQRLRMRCPSLDGPCVCLYCGRRNAWALWSRYMPLSVIIVLDVALLVAAGWFVVWLLR